MTLPPGELRMSGFEFHTADPNRHFNDAIYVPKVAAKRPEFINLSPFFVLLGHAMQERASASSPGVGIRAAKPR